MTRYLPTGDLDTAFGTGGTRTTVLAGLNDLSLAFQADGKIVAGGTVDNKFFAARFLNTIMTVTGPQSVAVGASATFSISNVSASTSGTVTGYQWSKDGV